MCAAAVSGGGVTRGTMTTAPPTSLPSNAGTAAHKSGRPRSAAATVPSNTPAGILHSFPRTRCLHVSASARR